MATTSTIAVEYSDGTISQIYCHWDGYLEHNGKILLNHYFCEEKIDKLVANGDLSSLAENIEQSTFYHRDRGEPFYDVNPRMFKNFKDYLENGRSEEFDYIFRKNGKWYYHSDGKRFRQIPKKFLSEYNS